MKSIWNKFAVALVVFTATATVGSDYWFHFKHRGGEQPYQTALKIRDLGKGNLIGDYWHAYILAAASPDSIIGTAHTGHTVRRISQARQMVNEPSVYLIKDNWLESFPDSIVQFNRLLIKDGESFQMAERELCNYRTAEIEAEE